jgi:hypothetical protein
MRISLTIGEITAVTNAMSEYAAMLESNRTGQSGWNECATSPLYEADLRNMRKLSKKMAARIRLMTDGKTPT